MSENTENLEVNGIGSAQESDVLKGLIASAKLRVKDGAGKLTPEDWTQAVLLALDRLNKDRPHQIVEDITGTGAHDYTLSAWEKYFSDLKSVEYPIGQQRPVYLLERDDYMLYSSPTGDVVRFLTITLAEGEQARATYTARHMDGSTVPPSDIDALANLVAAEACETLATDYAKTMNNAFGADVVKFESLSGNYAKRATALRKLYDTHIGVDKEITAAAATASMDAQDGYPDGSRRLVHRRKRF